MEKVDTLVVDKTGTLTEGRPTVTDMSPPVVTPQDDLLRCCRRVNGCLRTPTGSGGLSRPPRPGRPC